MAVSCDFADFVKGRLAPVSMLTSGRFFGGIGPSAGGVQFAMVMDHALYFVVSGATRPKYEQNGSGCCSSAAAPR